MARVIYENALDSEKSISDFALEGEAVISFPKGEMKMESSNESVLWCKPPFPADVRIDWEFKPLTDEGSAELHFAAKNAGEIQEFILSYYRRITEDDRAFHTCGLYKNSWDNLVYRGADPLPAGSSDLVWYPMSVVKRSKDVYFGINNMEILHFHDDGLTMGEILTGGNIGFGQYQGTKAMYRNLKVTWI